MHRHPSCRRGRASGSGPAGAFAAVAVVGLTACAAGSGAGPGKGSIPAFLGTASAGPVHQTLDGSAQHPALVSQGDAVRVHLRSVTLQARVTGPALGEASGAGASLRTHCTWTVELSQATAPVPLDLARFVISDTGARPYRPILAPGDRSVPSTLAPGATLRFHLQATLPNGEALLRWAPEDDSIPASWDFAVEND